MNLTVFAPKITHGTSVVAEAGTMAPQVITALVEAIESHPGINARRATETVLDPESLARTTDEFDYKALTTGVTRVRRGDFALVPEITLTGKRVRNGLDRRDEMLVSIEMHLFEGESYALVDHFEFRQQITTKLRSPFRTINILGQPRRPVILDAMHAPVATLVDDM